MTRPLHTAALWAPLAREVVLVHDGHRWPMRRDGQGWWTADRELTGPYLFDVDGDEIPDPRACRLPEGIDGPAVPLAPFEWTDRSWIGRPLADQVIYELHVGTFTPEGTFDGVVDHLDHLVDLGVTAIEVMPVGTFAGERGWGYDGVFLYSVHEPYGGPDGLRRLVDACHARELAVVVDVVHNHFGPTGNRLPSLGPYLTEAHHTPWGAAVNLDQPGSDEVRRYLVDQVLMFVRDFHVDGLRLDAVHALRDDSARLGDEPFLAQLSREARALGDELGRTVWVIGESDLNDPTLVDRGVDAPAGLDAVWSDDFHHAVHVALTGEHDRWFVDYEGWDDVARALERVYVYDGRVSVARGAEHGAPVGLRSRRSFVAAVQNHDQVGNRASGERLEHLVGVEAAQAAAALLLTSPFLPLLFQGEEWAASSPFQYFTDHPDPEVAAAVTAGRRTEFGMPDDHDVPDPQDEATHRRSVLDWDELEREPHSSMLRWYRQLLELRHRHPALRTEGPEDTAAAVHPDIGAFTVVRGQRVMVVVATGDQAVDVAALAGGGTALLTNDATWGDAGQLAAGRTVVLDLRPDDPDA